jgi:outer membrane protein assembly factor BamB
MRQRRAGLVLAVLVAGAVMLSPAGTPPASAAKKPKPTTTTTSTTIRPTTTTTVAPQPVNDPAVAYHGNPLHTGSVRADSLNGNLVARWTRDLGGNASYPVVAGGKVFVTVANASGYGTKLHAFDLATGATAWGPVDLGGTYWWSASAYEAGRLFVLNYDGVLRAFDAATGAQQWIVDLPGQWAFTSAPTASKGVVYTAGAGSGGTVYAVSAATGAILWTSSVVNGDYSSPVATDLGVFVSYSCPNVHALDPATGAQLWRFTDGCSGGGGKTAALGPFGLYVRDFGGDIVLDPTTGALTGVFSAGPIPALAGTSGWFLNGSVLEARDLSNGGTVLWSFAGDGGLTTAPVHANGIVYVGSSSGNVYALRAATGEVVRTVNGGSAVPAPDEHNVSQPLAGMAVGQGHLVVPATRSITVYGS